MNNFLKVNKNLLSYSLILFIVIPIFGVKFLISFLGNILILVFLIPLLLLLIVFIGFSSYKSPIIACNNCGSISIGFNGSCNNCGANLENIDKLNEKASESTIEIKAEEIN